MRAYCIWITRAVFLSGGKKPVDMAYNWVNDILRYAERSAGRKQPLWRPTQPEMGRVWPHKRPTHIHTNLWEVLAVMKRIMMIAAGLALIGTAACAQETTATHSGLYAAKLVNTTGAMAGGMDTALDTDPSMITVTAGTTYTLSLWLRNDRSQDSIISRISIAAFAGYAWISDTNFQQGVTVPGGTAWQKVSFDWVAPATSTKANISFRLEYDGNHQLVFDDVSFVNKAAPAAELISNGGFESWTAEAPDSWRVFGVGGASYTLTRIAGAPPAAVTADWQSLN